MTLMKDLQQRTPKIQHARILQDILVNYQSHTLNERYILTSGNKKRFLKKKNVSLGKIWL